jgi:hypothetical protein
MLSFLFFEAIFVGNLFRKIECGMTQKQCENIHLRPPEVGALSKSMSDRIQESGYGRTHIEAISDILKYTAVTPATQTMKPYINPAMPPSVKPN